MIKEERIKATLEEIFDELAEVKEALADDSFEAYADVIQDCMIRITNLLYVLSHGDTLEEDPL